MNRKITFLVPQRIKTPIRGLRSRWTRWRFEKRGIPGILCNEIFRFKLGYEPHNGSGSKFWQDDYLLQKTFVNSIRPGHTVVDVGAFVGHYTLLAARKVGPTGRVVAIEPLSFSYRILIEHLVMNDLLDRVDVWPIAAGNNNSFIKIYFQGHDPVRGHNSTNFQGFLQKGLTENLTHQTVPCVDLGSFLKTTGVKPDVIKIDVEGAEIEVLQSLRETLQTSATVYCELHPPLWKKPEVQFLALQRLMKDTGRSIETLNGDPWIMGQHEPVLLRKLP